MSLSAKLGISRKEDQGKIIRLDVVFLFLVLYATFSFIAIIVLTNTPLNPLSDFLGITNNTDLARLSANYLLITAPLAGFAPAIVGSYIYSTKELGPVLRPVKWGGVFGRGEFPDVAIIAFFAGLFGVTVIDYVFTYGGFIPTLSFWNTVTSRIAYSDGGVYEEFIFRVIFYGAINRFPGVGKVLLGNPIVYFGFTIHANVALFIVYHLKVYANSTLSLSIVAAEAYLINAEYRILKYCAWVAALTHWAINFSAPP